MISKIKISLIILSLLILTTDLWANPKKITFACNRDPNPPYVMGSGGDIDLNKPGITLEVLHLLEKSLNLEIHFEHVPAARIFAWIENNKVDGGFHFSFKTKRAKSIAYPMKDGKVDPDKRLMAMNYFLYKLKNSQLKWNGVKFQNLKGKIGANLGFSIVGDLKKMGVDVHEGTLTINLMRMLIKKRINGVVTIETLGDFSIKSHPKEFVNVVKVSPPVKKKNYYLALSYQFVKKHPTLAENIWNEIMKIRESGKFEEIEKKYLE